MKLLKDKQNSFMNFEGFQLYIREFIEFQCFEEFETKFLECFQDPQKQTGIIMELLKVKKDISCGSYDQYATKFFNTAQYSRTIFPDKGMVRQIIQHVAK